MLSYVIMATLQLESLIQNGMVLQQNTTNCICGTGTPDCKITLQFRGKSYSSRISKNGQWKICFNPGEAGGPDTIGIECSSGESVLLEEIYTGEVWLCSGQSNMQLTMDRLRFTYPEEMTAPENRNIRIFTVPIAYSFDGEKKSCNGGKWICTGPETIAQISGTSYFFAKELYSALKVPVGIINASQGGSPIASWINEKTVRKYPELSARLDECMDIAKVEEKKSSVQKKINLWSEEVNSKDEGLKNSWHEKNETEGWKTVTLPLTMEAAEGGSVWFKKIITLSSEQAQLCSSLKTRIWLGTISDSNTLWVNGTQCGETGYEYPPRRYEIPSGVLKEGENVIVLRVLHWNTKLSFRQQKPYCIFTDNVKVKATIPGNMTGTKNGEDPETEAFYLDLSGQWYMKEGCSLKVRPVEFFAEWEPTALYNSMLAPCFNRSVRGFLWYQGETDAGTNADYEKQLREMISLWRKKFVYAAERKAPFIVIQLPNFGEQKDIVQDSDWALLRKAQSDAVRKTANTGIAVLIDSGEWNDLHPENKLAAGKRSAMEALRIAYNLNQECSPYAKKIIHTDDGAIVEFSREIQMAGNTIPSVCGIISKDGKTDELCPLMVKAAAHTKLILMLPEEKIRLNYKIKQIRYAWTDSPKGNLLYDKKGKFPVEPFRMDF